MRAGQDYAGAAAAVAGSFAVTDASETTATTTGAMTDDTLYDVYVVAEDAAADENRTLKYVAAGGAAPADNLSPVYKTTVTTSDGTAPLFSGNPCAGPGCPSALHSLTYEHSAYPILESCSTSGFTLKVKVSEANSIVHYTVVGYADLAAIKAQSDPTNEEVSDGTSPYTPALTSSAITPLKTGSITCTSADTEYSAAVTGVGATGFYQVFVTVEGPNGNLGDGDVLRTANENPTKLAPCVAPQSGELITWTATDTTLKADVFLSAPAVVHYVLLRHDAPAPNPTQILLGLDANGASPPCAVRLRRIRLVRGGGEHELRARRHHDLERHWVHAGDVRESQQRGGVRPVHGHDALQRHGGGVGQHRPRPELRFLRGVFAKPDRPGDGPRDGQRRAALLGVLPQAGGRQGHDGDTPGEAERGGHGVVRRAGGGTRRRWTPRS